MQYYSKIKLDYSYFDNLPLYSLNGTNHSDDCYNS